MRHLSLVTKLLRLGTFLLFAQMVVTALMARHVYAEVQDFMHSIGPQLKQLGERVGTGEPRTLRLNGARIHLHVDHAPGAKLDEVLSHFEAVCRSRNGQFYEQLSKAKTKVPLGEPQLDFLDGVMRIDARKSGSVACFDVGDEQGSPMSILERAQRFTATGDASSFGELRYVRAEAEDDGVFVVMMWTDGPLNIKQMFPQQGDAPGLDFSDLPRPPQGRRVLSAWEEGEAPALNVYEVPNMNADALDRHYRSTLAKLGWQQTVPAVAGSKPIRGMMVMRDGVTAVLSHGDIEGTGHGATTILPMDTAGQTALPP